MLIALLASAIVTAAAAAKAPPAALTLLVAREAAIRVEDRKVTLLPQMTQTQIKQLMGPPDAQRAVATTNVRHYDYRRYGLRVSFNGQKVQRYEIVFQPKQVDAFYKAEAAQYKDAAFDRHLEGFRPAPARFDVKLPVGATMADVEKVMPARKRKDASQIRYDFDQRRGTLYYYFMGGRISEVTISR